jgi:hypothetical protein
MEITIKEDVCLMCGKPISIGSKVKAHLLPKQLKPIHNVFIYLHKECEDRINKLYVNQQTKSEAEKMTKKALNILNDFKLKINIMEDRIKDESSEKEGK